MSGGRRLGSSPVAGAAERSKAYYRNVADQLIGQIERGTARWTQAWEPGERPMPRNLMTGRAYRGRNLVWWLASFADQRGYGDERWGTYKQVQALGGQVRRGGKGAPGDPPDAHPAPALCVDLIALTAVRAGEARGACWDEIDIDAATWTIPASRMKAGRESVVPLSTGALDVLNQSRKLSGRSSFVFPSRTGGTLPKNAPGRVLHRAGVVSTVYGSVRARGRGWPNPASRRRSRRPALPMCRGARSFSRISAPTC